MTIPLDRIWDAHVVDATVDGTGQLRPDRHLVRDVSGAQAGRSLRSAADAVFDTTHAVSAWGTSPGRVADPRDFTQRGRT